LSFGLICAISTDGLCDYYWNAIKLAQRDHKQRNMFSPKLLQASELNQFIAQQIQV
jgi:hypothetical protein